MPAFLTLSLVRKCKFLAQIVHGNDDNKLCALQYLHRIIRKRSCSVKLDFVFITEGQMFVYQA